MKIVIIVQARTTSTRLPRKVMLPLAGEPSLVRQIERIMSASYGQNIIVATTNDDSDNEIVELCQKKSIPFFRGHPTDLLHRHYEAGLNTSADIIVKIPSDCPLIDPKVIDRVISEGLKFSKFDFITNLLPPTYPDGNDVEMMTMENVEIALREATSEIDREHTTSFFWKNPERFRVCNVAWETGLNYSQTHRWTLDYIDDYKMIRSVYDELYVPDTVFGIKDILRLLQKRPDIHALNQKYAGETWQTRQLNIC